jgi:hypothetical protein
MDGFGALSQGFPVQVGIPMSFTVCQEQTEKAALHVIAGQMTDSQIKDGAFAKGLALEGVEPKVETILLKEATVTETAPGKLKMLWRFAFVAEIASPLQQLCKF